MIKIAIAIWNAHWKLINIFCYFWINFYKSYFVAFTAACTLSVTESFSKILHTCAFAVHGLTISFSAISVFEKPCTNKSKTSFSLGVKLKSSFTLGSAL